MNQKHTSHQFIELKDYTHPEKCVYIFGNSGAHNIASIRPEDDIVTIITPEFTARGIFGVCIAAVVLYDREVKQ
jgi:hypothetical protein